MARQTAGATRRNTVSGYADRQTDTLDAQPEPFTLGTRHAAAGGGGGIVLSGGFVFLDCAAVVEAV